ncbi:protein Bouncer-like [Melanotaenia boesemani]|uniref:protein Bouncer-like n=1 Tax=Melanotaenia boesemani TaxID=1250792 RepID=UPI001C03AC7A|nr:protein Bouncer-like [Melanotaenia boesemani]
MKNLLLISVALMAMIVTGESLTCKTCRVGFRGRCVFTSTEVCSNSQPNCYSGKVAFNISSLMSLQSRGCMSSSLCNKTEKGTLLTAGYTITRDCCSTDFCNGATSVQPCAALVAAITAFWSPMVL